MLVEFSCKNYMSIRDEAVFSLTPVGDDVSNRDTDLVGSGTHRALRAAVVYGANASGKSNLINAIRVARRLIVIGTDADDTLPCEPFALSSAEKNKPSEFSFKFVVDGVLYFYSFMVSLRKVEEEKLVRLEGSDDVVLFERVQRDGGDHLTVSLPGIDEDRKSFFRYVAEGTRENQLFLCETRQKKTVEFSAVHQWFRDYLCFVATDSDVASIGSKLYEDLELRQKIGHMLSVAGTGAVRIDVERVQPSEGLSDFGKQLNVLVAKHLGTKVDLHENLPDTYVVKFLHKDESGAEIPFDLMSESLGTRRFAYLASFLADARPRLLIADELEKSLHPLLARQFVGDFISKGNSQIIFATHDTNLLGAGLPDDSIWFADKSSAGATAFYSLSEFDEKQLNEMKSNLERGYLQGRFGAVPFLRFSGFRGA